MCLDETFVHFTPRGKFRSAKLFALVAPLLNVYPGLRAELSPTNIVADASMRPWAGNL